MGAPANSSGGLSYCIITSILQPGYRGAHNPFLSQWIQALKKYGSKESYFGCLLSQLFGEWDRLCQNTYSFIFKDKNLVHVTLDLCFTNFSVYKAGIYYMTGLLPCRDSVEKVLHSMEVKIFISFFGSSYQSQWKEREGKRNAVDLVLLSTNFH